jgi:hypothetical protein
MSMPYYTHWAYFSSQAQATACFIVLTAQDFLVEVSPVDATRTDEAGQWLLRATRPVVIGEVAEQRDYVEAVVACYGGDYDFGASGWLDTSAGRDLMAPDTRCDDGRRAAAAAPILALELPPELPIDSVVCHPAEPDKRYRCWLNPNAGSNPTVWSPCSPAGELDPRSHTWWFVLFCNFGGLVEVVSTPACGVPAMTILSWQVPTEPPLYAIVAADNGDRYQRRPSALDGEILWEPLNNVGVGPRTWLDLLMMVRAVTLESGGLQ